MKKRICLLPLVLLVSCTNSFYHVASVQSEQVKLIDKDFVFENEHLKVIYDLWEKGGRMRFLLFNKTDPYSTTGGPADSTTSWVIQTSSREILSERTSSRP